MPEFAYQGRTASGKLLRGNMEAPSREAVINRLRAQRIQRLLQERLAIIIYNDDRDGDHANVFWLTPP